MTDSKAPKFFKQGLAILLILTTVFLLSLAIFNKSQGRNLFDVSSISGWFGASQDSVKVDSTEIDPIYSDSLEVVD